MLRRNHRGLAPRRGWSTGGGLTLCDVRGHAGHHGQGFDDGEDVLRRDGTGPSRGVTGRFVGIDDVTRLAEGLSGVRCTVSDGFAVCRYHGRLVVRQLDDAHVVIRADFEYRDLLLRQFPGTFSVPARYARHMMVVADLVSGDAGAIEDALEAAWQLQRASG